jgi:spore maturation protein CgeB
LFKRATREVFGAVAQRHAIGPIADNSLASFLSRGKISLGLNQTASADGQALVSYMKFRDLEFPGMGTCYLTQHNEDIEATYEVGREVETFKSLPELLWKAHALARQPARRRQMQQAAAQAVQARHNWTVRLREIMAHL